MAIMSATATTVDFKAHLVNSIRHQGEMFSKDIAAIPADKQDACPMGVARTPLNFMIECAWFNVMTAKAVSGEVMPMPTEEQRKAGYEMFGTMEKAFPHFKESVENLAAAIEGADESQLAAEIVAPWGAPISVYSLAHIAASHMGYHDGQLNYIQSLYGDGEMHWMD